RDQGAGREACHGRPVAPMRVRLRVPSVGRATAAERRGREAASCERRKAPRMARETRLVTVLQTLSVTPPPTGTRPDPTYISMAELCSSFIGPYRARQTGNACSR